MKEDELLRALRRWHEEEPDPRFRFDRFRRWAKRHLRVDAERTPDGAVEESGEAEDTLRTATSPNTFIRRFGSCASALAEAGVLEDISFPNFCLLARSDRYVSDATLLELIRDADRWAREEFRRPLTRATLDEYRERALRENWEAHTFTPVPSPAKIFRRFGGSLVKTMLAAGVINREEALRRVARRGVRLAVESLAAHVKVCARLHGVPSAENLTLAVYDRWRQALVDALLAPVPCSWTICLRLGAANWRDGVIAAARTTTDPDEEAALMTRYEAALPNASWA